MEDINVLISEDNLKKRIFEIAKNIKNDYLDEEIIFVSILTGALIFTSDLIRNFDGDNIVLDVMKVSSYDGEKSTGNLIIKQDLSIDIKDKNVIILEDIVDTGRTMFCLLEYLQGKNPKSLKICTLLDKEARREVKIKADYVGFSISNHFVVGYGLDYNDKYRNLPYIGYIK